MAIAEGMSVIVSAGNLGANAASYIPSAYGTMKGVICTGTSDPDDLALPSSNYGTPVDLLAPGKDISTVSPNAELKFELMSRTSPAAALTAAAVITQLSTSATRDPAEIENQLKTVAQSSKGLPVLFLPVKVAEKTTTPPVTGNTTSPKPDGLIIGETIPVSLGAPSVNFAQSVGPLATDSDGDGLSDVLETFHGSAPNLAGSSARAPTLALINGNEIQFTFQISAAQFDDNSPFSLRNGYSWRIRCSSNMNGWQVPEGSISKSTDAQGNISLTAKLPASGPPCFVRIEVVAPSNP